MITTIIILSLLVIFLGYSTLIAFRELELYEESIEESDQYVLEIKEQLDKAIQDMRKIDSKGIFEEDDEVGQTFKQILKIIEGLEK